MFYCFVYPESVDNILSEYFEKKDDVKIIEVLKCKGKEDFYITKDDKVNMYLKDGPKINVGSSFLEAMDSRNIIKSFTVKIFTYWIGLSRTDSNSSSVYEKYLELEIGEIMQLGKKIGNILIYRNERCKKILMEIFKKYELTGIDPIEDMNLNIINILQKINKI